MDTPRESELRSDGRDSRAIAPESRQEGTWTG
jgi:hypothetical protein